MRFMAPEQPRGGQTLAQIAGQMASGEISALDRLDQCLTRVRAEDDRWHAMLSLAPDARAMAKRADAAARDDRPLGPLHGVILAVKDNIDIAGMATTSGCRALANAMPRANAIVIDRLIDAGAIIMGKTNLSEFSFEIRSRSSLGGDVLCPFAPESSAGGSSGGSAVAVARSYAMAAIGTDTGGSIRIPAACNGLVGFRPAHGALSLDGVAPLAPSTDTIGPLTRTVADAEMLYCAMGGGIDAAASTPPRLGVLRQAFGSDPAIIAACEAAISRLEERGVELIDPFVVDGLEAMLQGTHIVDVEFAAAFNAYLAHNFLPGTAPANLSEILAGMQFLPDHRQSLEARLARSPAEAKLVLERHKQLNRTLTQAMADHDIGGLIYPTMQVIPQGLGNPKGGWGPELAARTGWPAITVPAPLDTGGRPVGVELLMPGGKEKALFDLARMIEA